VNELKAIPLRSKDESSEMYARGSVNGFVLITNESLGSLQEIALEHDNSGDNPSWFVETVIIRDRKTEEQWVFSINRWLALEKEDGQIEVTEDNKSVASFSAQVRSRFGRKIADGHLWVSGVGKACSSSFTRVQRTSCCLSVLFSAMIANTMFYNIGGDSDGAIPIGPFKFSWKQIVVGAQSGLIVAPVNILIVLLFKSKPKGEKKDKYLSRHNSYSSNVHFILQPNVGQRGCRAVANLSLDFEWTRYFRCTTNKGYAGSHRNFLALQLKQ